MLDVLYSRIEPDGSILEDPMANLVTIPDPVPEVYYTTLVEIADEFKERLKAEY